MPPVPRGVWSKPQGGEPDTWTEAGSRRSRKWKAPVHDVAPATTKGPTDAARLLESLRTMLPSLAGCAELTALADKVDEERKAAQVAKPLSVKAKHLEQRVAHKRRTQAEAPKRVEAAQQALESAQKHLESANSEYVARTSELQSLERDLAELPVEPQAPKFEGMELPTELAGDEEAAQAIAKVEAAAQEARALLADKLRAKRSDTTASPVEPAQGGNNHDAVERDGDDGHMELDEDDVDELVSTMVEQPDAATNGAGASADGESIANRAELKRRITAVANGIVRKKLKGRKGS